MRKIGTFLEMIKFEHTVFALPFAWLGAYLGARGRVPWPELGWVTLAMVSARTAGMCLNRLIDRPVDAENPRTRGRALVTGEIGASPVWAVTAVSFLIFALAVWQLPPLCRKLFPVAAAMLVLYHYMKRFTWACHFGVGLVLAFAPAGGWIAATGRWETGAGLLAGAVLFWVAGFDILYSLQDEAFDRERGLRSIPAEWGRGPALAASAACHAVTLALLSGLGILAPFGPLYGWGLFAAAFILTAEHVLIRRNLERYLNAAFFTMNGCLSILFSAATALALTRGT